MMPTQTFILFLILGMHCWAQLTPTNEPIIQRHPQSTLSAPAGGIYYLVNGTDGCPNQITWLRECQGFVLSPGEEGLARGLQKFCNINRGTKVTRVKSDKGIQSLHSTVREEDNMIRKTETTVFSNQDGPLSLQSEDTVIHDETGKLLWEHSRNNHGFSCLYSR